MEYNLEDYESRMVHDGKRNNREVKILCEICGDAAWVRWQRVRKGLGRFCGMTCAGVSTGKKLRKNFGKENAGFSWSSYDNKYIAYWKKEDGTQINRSKAQWLWEMNYGNVPDGHVIYYIDGDVKNCELDNLECITNGELTTRIHTGMKRSDEAKRKMSAAHTGKKLSQSHKDKIGQRTVQMWEDGVFDAPHIREVYSKQGKSTRGSKRTEETKEKMSATHLARYDDPVERKKMLDCKLRGEDHPNWRGGASQEVYPPEFSKRLREKIRRRDKYSCQLCSSEAKGTAGRVHHIDANKYNNKEWNLILFCVKCHGKVHARYEIEDLGILAFRSRLYNY